MQQFDGVHGFLVQCRRSGGDDWLLQEVRQEGVRRLRLRKPRLLVEASVRHPEDGIQEDGIQEDGISDALPNGISDALPNGISDALPNVIPYVLSDFLRLWRNDNRQVQRSGLQVEGRLLRRWRWFWMRLGYVPLSRARAAKYVRDCTLSDLPRSHSHAPFFLPANDPQPASSSSQTAKRNRSARRAATAAGRMACGMATSARAAATPASRGPPRPPRRRLPRLTT